MVKEVSSVPMRSNAKANREQVRKDITWALDNGIKCFEFDGDYNYKYLDVYAREEARRMTKAIIYKRIRELEKGKLTQGEKATLKPSYDTFYLYRRFIVVSTRKGDEHRRVFCEIDFSCFDELVENAVDEGIAYARSFLAKHAR